MSANPLRIALAEVEKSGEAPVEAQAPAELFSGTLAEGKLTGVVRVEGTIRRVDDDAVFEGAASGRAAFECSRCLEPLERDWREAVSMTVPMNSGAMDLTEEVRQAVGLSEPMKVFCKPDCKGLCPTCRKNLNTTHCGHVPAVDAPDTVRPRLTERRKKG